MDHRFVQRTQADKGMLGDPHSGVEEQGNADLAVMNHGMAVMVLCQYAAASAGV